MGSACLWTVARCSLYIRHSPGHSYYVRNPLIDALLQSPILPELLEEANRVWAAETTKRRKTFEEFPSDRGWEFIQGEVILHSPARVREMLPTNHLSVLMDTYVQLRHLGEVYARSAMTSFPRNDYEPDVMYLGLAKSGLLSMDTLRFPIPDLIVEVIAPSTEERDRGIKFLDYALRGVREYWIVDPVAETVEVYHLAGDSYPPAQPQKEGVVRSEAIGGFEIPVHAIFDENVYMAEMEKIMSGNPAA